jgi:putative Holliday junction resolvase
VKGGVLALDHGEKRTGLAVCDPLRIAVRPLEAWRAPPEGAGLFEHVEELLAERDVRVLLVGLPLDMDGGEGVRATHVRGFATRLAARFPAQEVVLFDERLTTKAAEELMREAGIRPEERRRLKDSWSALVLLRAWLESGEPRER